MCWPARAAVAGISLIALSDAAMRSDGEADASARPGARLERVIGRQIRRDRGRAAARYAAPRISLMARGGLAAAGGTGDAAWNSRGAAAKCSCAAAGFGNSGLGCGGIATRGGGCRLAVADAA